jgi:hypothetical protein
MGVLIFLIRGATGVINGGAIMHATKTTRRRPDTTWHGFAFELKPDTDLGLATLVIEYDTGAYEPLAIASTINEAREFAAADLAARMRRLERGEEPECPACYKLWAQGVDGRYLTVPVVIDPARP